MAEEIERGAALRVSADGSNRGCSTSSGQRRDRLVGPAARDERLGLGDALGSARSRPPASRGDAAAWRRGTRASPRRASGRPVGVGGGGCGAERLRARSGACGARPQPARGCASDAGARAERAEAHARRITSRRASPPPSRGSEIVACRFVRREVGAHGGVVDDLHLHVDLLSRGTSTVKRERARCGTSRRARPCARRRPSPRGARARRHGRRPGSCRRPRTTPAP